MQQSGEVIFVGAGPGDPELLTLKAAKALQKADVVITDRLVSEEIILEFVPYTAQVIAVGKQGGSGLSTSQKEINELLVRKAKQHKHVVRLKGGDVSVFSNILDELWALKDEGISYQIIPGITALSGAAAYTGIPLTARGMSTGIRVVTHYNDLIIGDEEWREWAKMKHTLVFYMSASTLPHLISDLLLHGAEPSTPFVVVEQATTPNQHVHYHMLDGFKKEAKTNHFISPSLVIIGKVAGLYKSFAWLPNNNQRKPYFSPLDDAFTQIFNQIKEADNVSRA
ncbi:MAG: uroporphyrinogen-III C-methyltransferase [Bacteroidota bacterium]|nr:uroporphyrinogen-III C-methyltransferase [Bacteroidota bacterium]